MVTKTHPTSFVPLELIIGGTPTKVVDNHQEVLRYWIESQIRGASLIHIDAHDDLGQEAPFQLTIGASYVNKLWEGNFVLPAVHFGIVDYYAWINPQAEDLRYTQIGASWDPSVLTRVKDLKRIRWTDCRAIEDALGQGVDFQEIVHNTREPLIVDIDLDAFCCYSALDHSPRTNTVDGWEQRVDSIVGELVQLPKPELITIARSVAGNYTPKDEVEAVQERVMGTLQTVYGRIEYSAPTSTLSAVD